MGLRILRALCGVLHRLVLLYALKHDCSYVSCPTLCPPSVSMLQLCEHPSEICLFTLIKQLEKLLEHIAYK